MQHPVGKDKIDAARSRAKQRLHREVKKAMDKSKLTQVAIATMAGLHPNRVNEIYNNPDKSTIHNAVSIAQVLGCELEIKVVKK